RPGLRTVGRPVEESSEWLRPKSPGSVKLMCLRLNEWTFHPSLSLGFSRSLSWCKLRINLLMPPLLVLGDGLNRCRRLCGYNGLKSGRQAIRRLPGFVARSSCGLGQFRLGGLDRAAE